MAELGTDHAARLLQRRSRARSTTSTSPPSSCTGSARSPPRRESRWPTRRWPGDATSTASARPGRPSGAPTTRPSRWPSTPSTCSRAATTAPLSPTCPGDRIGFLQVADAPLLDMNLLEWSRHHRCFPGQGTLDVTGVVAATLRGRATAVRCRSRCSATWCARRIRTSPRATRCARWCSSRTTSRASYPIWSRTSSRRPPPRAARTDAAFLEIASPPGDDHVDRAPRRPGLRRGRAAPHQAGHLVAQRRRPRRGQPRSRSATAARHRASGSPHVRSRPSPRGRPHCSGPRSTPPEGPARRCFPGSPRRRDCTSSSATRPGTPTTGRATSSRRASRRRAATSGSTTSSSRSPRCSSTRRWPSSGPCSASSPGRPRSSWSPMGVCAASRCARPRATCASSSTSPRPRPGPHPARRHPGRAAVRRRRVGRRRAARSRGVRLMPVPDNYYVDLDARFGLPAERPGAAARAPAALRPPGRGRAPACVHRGPRHRLPRRAARATARLRRLRQRQHLRPARLPARRHPSATSLIRCHPG